MSLPSREIAPVKARQLWSSTEFFGCSKSRSALSYGLVDKGDKFKTKRPKLLCLSANGNWTLAAGTKVAEKNAFSEPRQYRLNPPAKSFSEQNIGKIRWILGALSSGKYDGSNGAGGARGTGIEPSPLSQACASKSQRLRLGFQSRSW
jgi:hypothetical protein